MLFTTMRIYTRVLRTIQEQILLCTYSPSLQLCLSLAQTRQMNRLVIATCLSTRNITPSLKIEIVISTRSRWAHKEIEF